jgi:hypothetical protein
VSSSIFTKIKLISRVVFCFTALFCATVQAAEPHYYSVTKADIDYGEYSIHAGVQKNTGRLDYFRIITPAGEIELNREIMNQVSAPNLSTINLVFMPYLVEGEYIYFHEVGVSFYGERSCRKKQGDEIIEWAAKRELKIIFQGLNYTTRIDVEVCETN